MATNPSSTNGLQTLSSLLQLGCKFSFTNVRTFPSLSLHKQSLFREPSLYRRHVNMHISWPSWLEHLSTGNPIQHSAIIFSTFKHISQYLAYDLKNPPTYRRVSVKFTTFSIYCVSIHQTLNNLHSKSVQRTLEQSTKIWSKKKSISAGILLRSSHYYSFKSLSKHVEEALSPHAGKFIFIFYYASNQPPIGLCWIKS